MAFRAPATIIKWLTGIGEAIVTQNSKIPIESENLKQLFEFFFTFVFQQILLDFIADFDAFG